MSDMKMKHNEEEEEGDETDTEPSFEKVLDTLGPLGRFQIIQATFCYISMFLTSFIVLSFVIEGYEPPHVCNPVNETRLLTKFGLDNITGSYRIVYESCHIKVKVETANHSQDVSQGHAQGQQLKTLYTTDCFNGRNFHDAKHTTFLSEWDLVCESSGVAELSQTLFNVGQMIGAFIGSSIADRFGRKPVFIGSQFLATIAEFCIVAAPNIFVVYGLKFFSGIFYQSLVCCFFVYALEFITPRHREANGVIMCLIWIVGMLNVGALGYFLRNESWRYFQAGVGVSGLFCLAYPFVMYESPRWLAATGKTEEALHVLQKASKMNEKPFDDVKATFMTYVRFTHPSKPQSLPVIGNRKEDNCQDLSDDMVFRGIDETRQENKEKRMNMFDLLRYKSLRKTTFIAWFLFFTNVLTYFGIFMTSSNVAGNRFLNFILLILVEIPSNFCVYHMMKKMNRRLVLIFFLGLTAASLMASTLLITFAKDMVGSDQVSTVLFIVGKFAITASFNVIFIVVPEVFPTSVRSMANGFCSGMARPGAMVAPFLNLLYGRVKWGPGFIFVVMCMVAVFLTFKLPESKDADLPETLGDFNTKEKKKRNTAFMMD